MFAVLPCSRVTDACAPCVAVLPQVVRVPLIIAAPGLRTSHRCHRTVELIDVVPTLLDLLEVPPPPTTQATRSSH